MGGLNRSGLRAAVAGGGALLLAVCLAGCDYFPPDRGEPARVGLRMDGDALVIVPCDSIEATSILMQVDDGTDPLTRFYEVTGSVSVAKGDEFHTAPDASAPAGTAVRFTPDLRPGSILYVDFANESQSITSYFTIDAAGIPSDGWLQPDGTVSEWPCGYKR